MGALTDYAEVAALKFLTAQSVTGPSSLYLALFTSSGSDSSSGTEVSGGSYARQAITFNAPTSGAGTVTNAADVSFTNMPACTVSDMAVFDASTGGNRLFYGPLSSPQTINSGGTATLSAGQLTLSLD